MEKNLNEENSLALINEMIAQARNNYQKGVGNSFIFAGYSVAITAILNIVLLQVLHHPAQSYWIWLLMIPMQIGFRIIDRKRNKEAIVHTHIDTIISSVWRAFGIIVSLFLLLIFTSCYFLTTPLPVIFITPLILALVGFAQYITAISCRYILYKYAAMLFGAGSIISLLANLLVAPETQFVILAACMILGFVIPGHIINKKAQEYV